MVIPPPYDTNSETVRIGELAARTDTMHAEYLTLGHPGAPAKESKERLGKKRGRSVRAECIEVHRTH